MQRKFLAVLVAALVAAVAIASVAFAPEVLRNLSNPGSNPNRPGTGTGPQPTAVEVPTWAQGDSWTYDVSASSAGLQPDGPAAGLYDPADSATLETTLSPALNVWSSPPPANETWNPTSTATVHGWIQWQLSGPNATWKEASNFTYTEPVRLFLMSGPVAEVSTPAGAFSAIPVSMGHPELDLTPAGIAPDPCD